MTLAIKFPPWPDGVPPSDEQERDLLTYGETDAQVAALRAIRYCEIGFEDSGNPIEAIKAFVYATEVQLFPPVWTLEFISSRFRKASKGESLDVAFGFKARGKGRRTTPQQQLRYQKRNRDWCLNVFKLQALGKSRTQACELVAAFHTRKGRLRESISGKAVALVVKENEGRYAVEKLQIVHSSADWTPSQQRALLKAFDASSNRSSKGIVGN
jgi:hypothetical protein